MGFVDGYGAAKPKTGDNRKALSRSAGYSATSEACRNKTSSPHKGSSLHDKWQSKPETASNDNLKGYGD